jgi:glycosyltransferase involved in cell wall biosynthesis
MPKILRITTVPISFRYLLAGQMKYMSENGFEVLMISADGKEKDEVIRNEGCRNIVVPMTRKITPFKDLFCLIRLIYIILKFKPDIVHSHTPKAGLLGMLAAKLCFVKHRIHTVAGLPMMVATGNRFKLLKFIERLTYSCANHVWPNSPSLLNYIVAQKMTQAQKLSVILNGSSNGIDLKRFDKENVDPVLIKETKSRIQYDSKNIYLVTVGRIVKDKGVEEIVKAFLVLQKKYDSIKLLLVGQFEDDLDPISATIKEEIETNHDIIHIEWTPNVEYYISVANIFVFASHREGFPNVLLQAGALKTPIVCSSITGNIDIVENEISGLTFACGKSDELTSQLIKLIENPTMQLSYTTNLYNKIHASFAQTRIWEEIKRKYIELVS